MSDTNKIGIYKIENLINHKIYIGKSKNIQKRWKAHKTTERKRYPDKPLYKAFNKYGLDNFHFSIVELCDESELNEKEIYWINYYNSFNKGYNMTLGGDGYKCGGGENSPGNILNQNEVEKIQKMLFNGASAKEIQKIFPQASDATISYINLGKTWFNEKLDYPLKKRHGSHRWTDEEAMQLRKEFSVTDMPLTFFARKKDICPETFRQLINGDTYKHLPTVKKVKQTVFTNSSRKISPSEVVYFRNKVYNEGRSILSVWENEFNKKISYSGFRNMIKGITYKDIDGVPNEL